MSWAKCSWPPQQCLKRGIRHVMAYLVEGVIFNV